VATIYHFHLGVANEYLPSWWRRLAIAVAMTRAPAAMAIFNNNKKK
jgi:hypothetical protein